MKITSKDIGCVFKTRCGTTVTVVEILPKTGCRKLIVKGVFESYVLLDFDFWTTDGMYKRSGKSKFDLIEKVVENK